MSAARYISCAIDLDLVAQLHLVRVKRFEVRLALIDHLDDVVRKVLGAFAAVGPVRAQERLCPHALGGLFNLRDFRVCVGDEFVDRDDGRNPELVDVLDVALEVLAALGDGGGVLSLQIVLGDAAMHLQCADRRERSQPPTARCRPCGT